MIRIFRKIYEAQILIIIHEDTSTQVCRKIIKVAVRAAVPELHASDFISTASIIPVPIIEAFFTDLSISRILLPKKNRNKINKNIII